MIKRVQVLMLLVLAVLMPFVCSAKSSEVGVSVSVVERKTTDTINDFNLSRLAQAGAGTGQVFGAQTQKSTKQLDLVDLCRIILRNNPLFELSPIGFIF